MHPTYLADRLLANAAVFQHLLAQVDDAQARWKPSPEKWSMLEVINHLADEERHDFRSRVELTLLHSGEAWPPIHPSAWSEERQYNTRDLAASLRDFLSERERSVGWLMSLPSIDADAAYSHPALGRITVRSLMSSWLAHDLIHIRQLTRLHYEHLRESVGAEAIGYAGTW